MTETKHPTNDEWELFDPLVRPPPRGASLLLINEGGVLIVGQWYDRALAWGYKPKIPASVKARVSPQRSGYQDAKASTTSDKRTGQG